jgi:heme-degrading monooxygenase HmoA
MSVDLGGYATPRRAAGRRVSAMIMRVTWGKLWAGTWQEYEQAYHATVAGKEVPGLRGRWLAQDVNDPDGGFSVSVWDMLDAMQAYEQSAVFKQVSLFTLDGFTPHFGDSLKRKRYL